MKNQLPYNEEIIDLAQVIFFENTFYEKEKWLRLKDQFPNVLKTQKMKDAYVKEMEKLEYNYRKIVDRFSQSVEKISPITFWRSQANLYPTIYLVARAVFVLPYSSVSVERVFSNLKDIKNAKRNRLNIENLEACLLGYQHARTEDYFFDAQLIEDYLRTKKDLETKQIEKGPIFEKKESDLQLFEDIRFENKSEEMDRKGNLSLEEPIEAIKINGLVDEQLMEYEEDYTDFDIMPAEFMRRDDNLKRHTKQIYDGDDLGLKKVKIEARLKNSE